MLYRRAWPVLAAFVAAAVALLGSSCAEEPSIASDGAVRVAGALLPQIGQTQEDASASAGFEVDDGWLDGYSVQAPEGFRAEVFDCSDAVYSEQGSTVNAGFTLAYGSEEALALLVDELEGKGWNAVSNGEQGIGTFVKKSGTYRWAAVTCTEVDGAASVVVTARRCGDG